MKTCTFFGSAQCSKTIPMIFWLETELAGNLANCGRATERKCHKTSVVLANIRSLSYQALVRLFIEGFQR